MHTQRLFLGLLALGLTASGCATASGGHGDTALSAPGTSAALAAPEAPSDDDGATSDGDTVAIPTTWVGGAAGSKFIRSQSAATSVGVWVDVPDLHLDLHVPTALTLAIDTSGSMHGENIANAREAARSLIEELPDGDYVSLVTFSDRARVLQPATELTPHSRRQALALIDHVEAAGGTALHDGVAVAQSQFASVPRTHLVRRVVVVSDGKATVGPKSPAALGALAQNTVADGVQVTSLGVGLDYDEVTLNEMAIRSAGRLYHLAHAEDMSKIIRKEMDLLQASVAARGFLEVVPAEGVSLKASEEVHASWHDDRLTIPLGTMYAGQTREILLQAMLDGRAALAGERPLASVRFHYSDAGSGGLRRVQESIVSAEFTSDTGLIAEFADPRTQELIASHHAAELTFAATRHANAGNLKDAQAQLEEARVGLLKQAKVVRSKPAKARLRKKAKRLESARDELKKADMAPAKARKKKSRATALDLNDNAMEAYGY